MNWHDAKELNFLKHSFALIFTYRLKGRALDEAETMSEN